MNRGSIAGKERWPVYDRRASMRPRFMNRGSALLGRIEVGFFLASMRPRFMNRGSNHGRGRRPQRQLASMRPRFMNRGSEIASDGVCGAATLQ